jgi:hypothetical protein
MKKIILLNSILLVVVFLAGCGQQPVSQVQPVNSSTPKIKIVPPAPIVDQSVSASQPDKATEWEIYKNKKNGFEINYPKSLKVIEENESVKFIRDCSRLKDSENIQLSMKCQVEGDFTISLYHGPIKKFIEDFKDDCNETICLKRIISQDSYILNNITATKLTGTTSEGALVINYIFVTKNNKNYILFFNNYVDEYNKMISSFKFI